MSRNVKLRTDIERQIYTAAYVAEFNRLHNLGVHRQFDLDYPDVSERVTAWELWCAESAIDSGESLVSLHRKGMRARRLRMTRQSFVRTANLLTSNPDSVTLSSSRSGR